MSPTGRSRPCTYDGLPRATAAESNATRARLYDTQAGLVEAAVAGKGPAILLVHGTLGSWRQVSTIAADLSSQRTGVLVSRPGYGRTPVATGRTYEQQADAYAALLDRLSIARSAVLGISSGAPSAIAFGAKFPDRCEALILCGALAPQLASTRGMWATAIPGVVRIWVMIESARRQAALRDPSRFERYLRGQLSGVERRRATDPEIAGTLRDFVRLTSAAPLGVAGLLNDIRGIRRAHRCGPEATPVRVPTLVLHGAEDHLVPLAHGAFHASSIPGAILETYAGGAHLFLQTFRAEARSRIQSFLATSPSPTPGTDSVLT